MHKIVKYGRLLWVIIEPVRGLFLRNQENNLLTFKNKEQALTYCKENKLEVSEEYA
jgi:hypothetical protein